MYKTVIVPVDIAHADKAQSMIATAKLLGGDQAKIVLANVVEEIPSYVVPELPENMVDKSMERARQELAKIADATEGNVSIDVRCGQVTPKLLEIAQELDADAIVVASHRPGLQDYFLGSTAARVVRHAQCSVVVIR